METKFLKGSAATHGMATCLSGCIAVSHSVDVESLVRLKPSLVACQGVMGKVL